MSQSQAVAEMVKRIHEMDVQFFITVSHGVYINQPKKQGHLGESKLPAISLRDWQVLCEAFACNALTTLSTKGRYVEGLPLFQVILGNYIHANPEPFVTPRAFSKEEQNVIPLLRAIQHREASALIFQPETGIYHWFYEVEEGSPRRRESQLSPTEIQGIQQLVKRGLLHTGGTFEDYWSQEPHQRVYWDQ
ncbi:MAG: hypothetical protein VX730_07955 [Pseudomonadota bacterium]|nr:hypothetical protein [Pseudomonadota bacterium]